MKTIVLALACVAFGFGLRSLIPDQTAVAAPVREAAAGRYALSSFGDSASGSCFVLDTATGHLWGLETGGMKDLGLMPEVKAPPGER